MIYLIGGKLQCKVNDLISGELQWKVDDLCYSPFLFGRKFLIYDCVEEQVSKKSSHLSYVSLLER